MARSSDRGPGLDGILVLAKPAGPTSHDMVALVRRITSTRRVGHGGTLDPFASGVLPVFLGRATRLVEYHMADRKAYRATICLGAGSSTDDVEGELTPGERPAPDRDGFEAVLDAFRGSIEQRPPAYSALKVAGRRAYEIARGGSTPELAMRSVTVTRLDLIDWDGSDASRPLAVVEVECGAGTYIRALARDIGERLGCGGYLGTLVRTASGPFGLADAHDPESLRSAAAEGPDAIVRLLLPIDAGLDALPTLVLAPSDLAAATRGQVFKPLAGRPARAAPGEPIRLVDAAGTLVGIGTWSAGRIAPDKILVPPADIPAGVGEKTAPGDAQGGSGVASAAGAVPADAAEPRDPGVDGD